MFQTLWNSGKINVSHKEIIDEYLEKVEKGKASLATDLEQKGGSVLAGYENFIVVKIEKNIDGLIEFLRKERMLIKGNFGHP